MLTTARWIRISRIFCYESVVRHMAEDCYAEWRNRRTRGHFGISIFVAVFSCLLCFVIEAGADTTGDPVPQEFYDHPLLFLCITILLCVLISVLLLSRRKLQASERRYRSLFTDNGAVMLLIEPASLRIMDANPAACVFYGWSPADLLNKRITDINTLPESEVKEIFLDVLNYEMRRFLSRHRLASGEERDVEENSMPYRLEGRECLLSIIHDITAQVAAEQELELTRQRAEEALRQSTEELRAIYDGIIDGIIVADVETGQIAQVNDQACRMFGYSREEFLHKNPQKDLHPPEAAQRVCNHFAELREGVENRQDDIPCLRIDGSIFFADIGAKLITLNGRLCAAGFFHNITGRVLAEQEVERSRDEWVRTFDAVPDLISILAPDYTIRKANRTMADALGMTPAELAGKRCYEYVHGTDSPPQCCPHNLSLQDGREHTVEVFEPRLGGNLMVTVSPLHDTEGRILGSVHVVRNINKRVQAEDLLRESEERYRRISDLTSDFVYSCRRAGDAPYRLDWIAGAFEAMSGYAIKEIEELGCWLPFVYEDDREHSIDTLHGLRPGDFTEWECRLVARSGEICWLLNHAACTSNDNGTLILYGAAQNITERKLTQERILASLREKELLLKEIHHRVKNNLQIISSLLNLQAAHSGNAELASLFRESQNRVLTMALIHEKLYRSDNLAYIDFGAYLRDLAASLFRSYHSSARKLRLHIDVKPITFGIDTAVPCSLLVNELISNALKYAFPDGREGTIRIELHLNRDTTCSLIVSDTGVGLPDGFDIRKTETLGMELIRNLTIQLDGTLEVDNNYGTRFTITFNRQE